MIALNEARVLSDPVNHGAGAGEAFGIADLVKPAFRIAEAMAPATLAVVANFPLDDSSAFDSVHPATMARSFACRGLNAQHQGEQFDDETQYPVQHPSGLAAEC
jgi:hypothetical protein